MTEWKRHDRRYPMTYDKALDVWRVTYSQILERHRHQGEWVFFHYDQLLDGSAVTRLEQATGVGVNATFPDPSLRRTEGTGRVTAEDDRIYAELCGLAGF